MPSGRVATTAAPGDRMTNAEVIVRTLDELLDHEISLVLYGRAAVALGFADPPAEVCNSLDVDVIVRLSQTEQLNADDSFWQAQQETNMRLKKRGLYITHLFEEDWVFLRPDWERHLVPINSVVLRWLRLFRPATLDLILTKMMRGNDAQDMADIEFMIRHDRVSPRQVEEAMTSAVIPDLQELRDAFAKARVKVREIAARLAFP